MKTDHRWVTDFGSRVVDLVIKDVFNPLPLHVFDQSGLCQRRKHTAVAVGAGAQLSLGRQQDLSTLNVNRWHCALLKEVHPCSVQLK